MDSLNSIFNIIRVEKNDLKKTFKLFDFDNNGFNMPTLNDIKLSNSDYKKVIDHIKNNLNSFKENINPEELAVVLEACCSYFPSSSYVDTPDVSYYDHVKLTAAISACFYLYDKEKNIDECILTINSFDDIDITSKEIINSIEKKPGPWVKTVISKLEKDILLHKLNNNKKDILDFLSKLRDNI